MKKIIIRESPTIICPVDNKVHLLSKCDQCDAFKGHQGSDRGNHLRPPTVVKCIADEF